VKVPSGTRIADDRSGAQRGGGHRSARPAADTPLAQALRRASRALSFGNPSLEEARALEQDVEAALWPDGAPSDLGGPQVLGGAV